MGFKNIIERFAINYAHNTMQKSLYNGSFAGRNHTFYFFFPFASKW